MRLFPHASLLLSLVWCGCQPGLKSVDPSPSPGAAPVVEDGQANTITERIYQDYSTACE